MNSFLPRLLRLTTVLLAYTIVFVARSSAQSVPYLLEPTTPAPSMRLTWQTEPGVRYDLWQSTDLFSWAQVSGFPAPAVGLSQEYVFNLGPRGFFRIVPIDEQPPIVTGQFPASAGFAVGQFADLILRLADPSGIDPATIRLTVGSVGPLAMGAPGLTFSDGTLTYDSGASPLGAWGETVTATLIVADTLGHTLTHTWSFKLEPEPVVSADIFVFGNAPAAFGDSWSIESVAADRIVIAYTGTTPTFPVGKKLCNSSPIKVQDIFYRRVLSVSDNPATSRLTVFTEDIPLTDFVQQGSVSVPASPVVFTVASDGTLVSNAPFSVSGTYSFPRVGLDLSGTNIKLGSGGDFEATIQGVTLSNGSSPHWLDVTATELSWWFTPRVQLALEIGLGGLKSFEAIASGDISLNQAFEADVTLLGVSTKTTIWQLAGPLRPRYVVVLGAIGPVPVYAEVLFTFSIETEARAEAVLDLSFAYRQDISASFGVTYHEDSGLKWPSSFQASAPDLSGDVDLAGKFTLKVTLVPKVSVLIYSAAGFSAAIEPYGGIEVRQGTGGYDGKLFAGVDFTLEPAGPLLDALIPDDWKLTIAIVDGEWPLSPATLAFTSHPQSRIVAPAADVSFTCTVDSSSPASFQWFHRGLKIPGQTLRTLFLSRVNAGHAGSYFVRATAGAATVDSDPATLTVQIPTPANTDTDGDGLPDAVETRTGVWVSPTDTGTNPLLWDTDGDGLRDGVETHTGIFISASNTGTDPNDPDTDDDGVNDKTEINAGANPNAPAGMALIPAGSFQMGDASTPFDGATNERPPHTVYMSAFYMDRYEVTKALWDEVRAWGLSNGYTDLPVGSYSGSTNYSKGPTHPVHYVSWYAMVKWCNARSQKEGLMPCYYTNDAQTVIYKTGSVNVTNAQVKWSANGYRLPTEAEWEKAARGGLSGKRFPWGDTITHLQANYYSSTSYSYDISLTRNYHPIYGVGPTPYTSPVGSFAPNAYGIYDMAGNVWEWCWDWYGSSYYSTSPSTDPQGPPPGSGRVIRGGSWAYGADASRAAGRNNISPGNTSRNVGFRTVRR